MAKKRHTQEPPPTSNRATMLMLVAGGVLVGALVVWALTRTVEPASQPTTTDASTSLMPGPATQPVSSTAIPTATPGTTAAAQTPPPAPQGDRNSVGRIAVEDLRAKMNRNEVTVIDVRDAAAFNARRIPGSINVPFASVETMLDQIPKNKPIVTYCT